jgi:hypothetical protein
VNKVAVEMVISEKLEKQIQQNAEIIIYMVACVKRDCEILNTVQEIWFCGS